MRAIEAFVVLLGACEQACAGGFSDSDTKAAQDISRLASMQLELCQEDAGTCNAGQIRALARPARCAALSMLYRHGHDVDAGTCPP